jgi:membrane-bound lytic murein transglycosylase F
MMLTEDTADFMKVSNRLDPKQSILAGAKYFWDLKDKFPERIPEPDRTWLALAAYNIGFGHLEDARILAVRKRLNPDSWTDVKKTLPLLTNSKYFSKLKHGYASGGAPVVYVENIRTYYDIMVRFEKSYQPDGFPSVKGLTISSIGN